MDANIYTCTYMYLYIHICTSECRFACPVSEDNSTIKGAINTSNLPSRNTINASRQQFRTSLNSLSSAVFEVRRATILATDGTRWNAGSARTLLPNKHVNNFLMASIAMGSRGASNHCWKKRFAAAGAVVGIMWATSDGIPERGNTPRFSAVDSVSGCKAPRPSSRTHRKAGLCSRCKSLHSNRQQKSRN